jgi:RHS repeat-associated protein
MDKRSSDTYNPSDPVYGYSAFEEYRYDALGRRILRRSRDGSSCTDPAKCHRQLIQRFVWDGSHILAEIQYPGGDGVSPSDLERDTVTIVNNSARYWGRVLYVTGSDPNQPLATVRIGYGILTGGGSFDTGPNFDGWDPVVIAPAWDWHGDGTGHAFYGPTSPTKADGGTVSITWPSRTALAYQMYVSPNDDNNGFFGSLLIGQRDGTGQIYKVNRYYDPRTGRFTQEDPIGLAGGLNLYGFANGDPVNFSDPFGLCKDKKGNEVHGLECDIGANQGLASPGFLDPVAWLAGGLAGGLRAGIAALFVRSATTAAADALATSTAAGAEALASQVAEATGGTVAQLAKSQGFKVTIEGARNVVVRIKEGGAFRVSIEGIGSLTREGVVSGSQALTHLTAESADEIIELTKKALEWVATPR